MSVISDKNKLLRLLDFYEQYLKTVNDDVFLQTVQPGVWSLSEVYAHVLGVLDLCAIAVENCLNKTAPIRSDASDWRVRAILFLGFLPPVKYKAPPAIAARVKKITREEASNQLIRLRKRLDFICADFKKFEPKYKVKHPVMGYLHAKSWLKFMVVHTKHHISQISRLEKLLDTVKK